jgi:hypothetical protein
MPPESRKKALRKFRATLSKTIRLYECACGRDPELDKANLARMDVEAQFMAALDGVAP